MPDSVFILKEPKATKETLVYLLYNSNGVRVKVTTGRKIHPKYWNPETQRAKQVKDFPHSQFNNVLKTLDGLINKRELDLINEGKPITPENLKKPIIEYLNKETTAFSRLTFKQFIEDYIKKSTKKPNTIKQYNTSSNRLKSYETNRRKNIDFDDVNLEFYEDFNRYMIEKNYSLNSIGTSVKNIKVFMNEAVEKGLTKNLEFRNKKFKIVEEETENIYLTEQEIKAIYEYDFSDNPRLDRVRDLFVIACYTGLRYSDLIQIREENLIDERTKIKVKTEKTGAVVVIPLNSMVKNILAKHNGVLPELISNVKMNEYIKQVAEKAEINDDVVISFTKGGIKKTETFKKYELVTVHTARRSFATNAYLRDIPTISIMKITGHTTERAFMKYIKISQEENAIKLTNHPFFN
ncbi:MAG: site-specific integrase [Sphingobacteriia bacterium]|nr:site-specific integrase [Sphingobacteriia bacterium]